MVSTGPSQSDGHKGRRGQRRMQAGARSRLWDQLPLGGLQQGVRHTGPASSCKTECVRAHVSQYKCVILLFMFEANYLFNLLFRILCKVYFPVWLSKCHICLRVLLMLLTCGKTTGRNINLWRAAWDGYNSVILKSSTPDRHANSS